MKKFTGLAAGILLINSLWGLEELEDATPQYIQEYTAKASKSFESQNYKESLEHIRHVIKSDMTNFELRMLAAHNHWRLTNYEPASIHFQTAAAAKPDEPGPYIDLAMMMLQLNEPTRAREIAGKGLEQLEKAGKEVPAKIYTVLARAALLQGDVSSAIIHCTSAKAASAGDTNTATSNKDKLEAIILEGRAQLATGNFDKAELTLSWADSLRPNNVYIRNLLGYTYERWAAAETDPQKKKQLLAKAREKFSEALESTELAPELKNLIEKNLARVKEG